MARSESSSGGLFRSVEVEVITPRARQIIWEHIVSFGWNIFFFLAGVVFLVVSIHLAVRYW